MESSYRLANSEDGPRALQIRDEKISTKLQKYVLDFWPERKNNYFPAPQPVSLERRDLFKLKKFTYMVCVKSDGMRFLMVCLDNKCYMVDRAFRFYKVEQDFEDNVYKGSVFDGELIKTKNALGEEEWTYIVHDCISFAGKNTTKLTFTERYECVDTLVEMCWNQNDGKKCSFNLQTKTFMEYSKIEDLIDTMNNESINHNTDGIIFTPVNLPVGMHTQHTLFKWKPRELNTFDFKIMVNSIDIIAQVSEKRELTDFASVDKSTENGKTFNDKLKNIKEFKNGSIVECDYNEVTECYEPLFVRTGKTHPNGIYTVDKTHLNIRENITIEELIKLSNN